MDRDFEIVDGLADQRTTAGMGFGDYTRVRVTPDTERAGFAGRTGDVFGETDPSRGTLDGETVIGGVSDFALYVHFDDDRGAWFAPDLLTPEKREPAGMSGRLLGLYRRVLLRMTSMYD